MARMVFRVVKASPPTSAIEPSFQQANSYQAQFVKFRARAMDANGRLATHWVEATDLDSAKLQLTQQGWTTVDIHPERNRSSLWGVSRSIDLVLFCQELHALLTAGLNVRESLELLRQKKGTGAGDEVLATLLKAVEQGYRLSAAMAQQSEIFPPLLVGLVRSAEMTSELPQALERFIDYEGRLTSLRQKLVSAAIYPVILAGVGAGVAAFLMGYVVPRFAQVYRSGGKELPWASRLLLDTGTFLGDHRWLVLAATVSLVLALMVRVRRHLRDGTWWRLLSILPGAAPKLEALEISRLYLTLGMLLQGGLPILAALRLSEQTLSQDRRQALQRVAQRVSEGEALTDSLQQEGLTTVLAQRLLKVGEKSGQLGEMLVRTATFFEDEASRWIERFSKVFEPVLMAAIGLVIGAIVVLLYMPIFELAGSLQ